MRVSKLKSPVRARRLSPLRSTTHCTISRVFEEALFRNADTLSEGLVHEPGSGTDGGVSYTGSTMLTIDLRRLGDEARAEFVQVDRERLFSALDGSMRVRLRAMRLAMAEAARRCTSGVLGTAQIETRLRLEGDLLHIDVDVEAPVQQISDQQQEG